MKVFVLAAALALLCLGSLHADEDQPWRASFGKLFPQDSRIWQTGWTFRMLADGDLAYGEVGFGNVPLAKDVSKSSGDSNAFWSLGAGYKLVRFGHARSFIGIGGTLYIISTNEVAPGNYYVDQWGNPLAPYYEQKLCISPEISAHLQLSKAVGIESGITLGRRGQSPVKGSFLALTAHW